jgi:transposase
MARLGMRTSHTTILRRLKQHAGAKLKRAGIRVAGIDEWAWRKGTKFGTIVVDLERRRVVDLLADRRADRTADWLRQHPEVEIINRDRDAEEKREHDSHTLSPPSKKTTAGDCAGRARSCLVVRA